MLARCFFCGEYSDTDCLLKVKNVYTHKDCYENNAYPLTSFEKRMEVEMKCFFRAHPEMKGGKK